MIKEENLKCIKLVSLYIFSFQIWSFGIKVYKLILVKTLELYI